MNVLFVAAIFAQLNSFQFGSVSSPQTAGNYFSLGVAALDSNGDTVRTYNGTAYLASNYSPVPGAYTDPGQLTFSNGICRQNVVVYLAADTFRLKVTDQSGLVTGWSNPFDVHANSPGRFVTLMPGQVLVPGSKSGSGRSGAPWVQTAGRPCSLTTYLTDNWMNPVQMLRNDSFRLLAVDPFAQFPANPQLSNGIARYPATFRRAGVCKVFTYPKGNTGIRADTSTQFDVLRGPFSQLLMILPGETLLAGDTTTVVANTPGKTGRVGKMFVRHYFPVKVLGVDSCWNQTPVTPESIYLRSDFAFSCSLPWVPLRDTGVYNKAMFFNTGNNQTFWAEARASGRVSYRCMLDIQAKTDSIAIWLADHPSDTLRAGQRVRVNARLFDLNGATIAAKWCVFSMHKGHGRFIVIDSLGLRDSLGYGFTDSIAVAITDSSGMASAIFVCDAAHNAEEDTVKVSADGYSKLKRIYILGDTDVLAGRMIAYPNPLGLEGIGSTIEYFLPGTADNIALAIYDPFGNPVMTRDYKPGTEGNRDGICRVHWDGRNALGQKVASGVYVVKVWGLLFTSKSINMSYRLGVIW
jgi:hypothetical protein